MSQQDINSLMDVDPRRLTTAQLRAIRKHNEDNRKFEEWNSILEAATKRKNILTVSEFKKYEPIYKKMSIEDISDPNEQRKLEMLQELSSEFYTRIDPYSEITIVDDYNPDHIVAVLPKMYTAFNTLKEGHEQSLTEFDRLTNIPYRNDLKEEGMEKLVTAIALSQDITFNPELKQQEQNRFVELSNTLLNNVQSNTNISKNINTNNTTDIDNTTVTWEFDDD